MIVLWNMWSANPLAAQNAVPPLTLLSANPDYPLIPFYPTVIQHVKIALPDSLGHNGKNTAYGCIGCKLIPAEPVGTHFLVTETSATSIRVEALQGGKVVAQASFPVPPIPQPIFAWWLDGKPYNAKQTLKASSKLQLWHKADSAFLAQSPYDARYSLKLALYRGTDYDNGGEALAYFDATPVSDVAGDMPLELFIPGLAGQKTAVVKIVVAYRITGANMPIDITAELPADVRVVRYKVKIKAKKKAK